MPIMPLNAQAAPKGGYELTILYGSEANHAKDLALTLQQEADARGCDVTLNELDEVSVAELASKKHVVVICSTAGNGEFPKNAATFAKELMASATSLAGVEISVFGLGDSSFANYNLAAKTLQDRFAALGAKMAPLALGNDQDPERYMTAWEQWNPAFWAATGVKEPEVVGVPASVFEVELKEAGSAHVSRRRFLPATRS